MIRKPIRTRAGLLPAATLCVGVIVAVSPLPPSANADLLPNGYDVTCVPNGIQVICNISGCPRVFADEAGDVIHIKADGDGGRQDEVSKGCNNTATETYFGPITSATTISVQGCRKHPFSSDDCGPWSDYTYNPPHAASPPAPQPADTGPTYAPEGPQTGHVTGGDLPVFNIAHDDVKDPTNGVQGLKIATLPDGTHITFDGPCNNGWCRIKSPLIPRGFGFAQEQFLFLG